jgi:transposase
VRRSYKYRLYPTKEQEQKLFWTLKRCRELYNAALTERRDAYTFHVRQHGSYYDQQTRQQLTSELTVNYSQQKGEWLLSSGAPR